MTNERCKRCHHPKSDHQEACLKCRCEAFSCPDVCHTCKGRGYIIVGSGVPGTYSARNTSCPTCTKNELTERVRAALNDRTQTASKWADDDGGPNTFGASSWETGAMDHVATFTKERDEAFEDLCEERDNASAEVERHKTRANANWNLWQSERAEVATLRAKIKRVQVLTLRAAAYSSTGAAHDLAVAIDVAIEGIVLTPPQPVVAPDPQTAPVAMAPASATARRLFGVTAVQSDSLMCGLHGRNAIDLNGVCIECERNSTKWREVTLVQDSAVIHGKQVIVYESSVGRWCWTASNGSSYNDRDSARAAAESELENDLHSQVTALKDALNLALCAINEEINRDHGRREYLLGIAKTARDALK